MSEHQVNIINKVGAITLKVIAGIMITACLAFGKWNLNATHENALELAVLRQLVIDGKESRLSYQQENIRAHETIMAKLTLYDGRFVELSEMKAKLGSLEATVKNIESQLVELRVGGKNTEAQLSDLKTTIKVIEREIVELRTKIISIEEAVKKKL